MYQQTKTEQDNVQNDTKMEYKRKNISDYSAGNLDSICRFDSDVCPCIGDCPDCLTQIAQNKIDQSLIHSNSLDDIHEREADNLSKLLLNESSRSGQSMPISETNSKNNHSIKNHDGKGLVSSSGQSLPDGIISSLMNSVGVDFSNVRIYTGREPDHLVTGMDSRAFTIGDNIYFAQGEYLPQTTSGYSLLIHELAHTIQQNPNHNLIRDSPFLRKHITPRNRSSLQNKRKKPGRKGGRKKSQTSKPNGTRKRRKRKKHDKRGQGKDLLGIEIMMINPDELESLTNISLEQLPEGGEIDVAQYQQDRHREKGKEISNIGPIDKLGLSVLLGEGSVKLIGLLKNKQALSAVIPDNSIGIHYTRPHTSVFAKVNGELIMKGYRGKIPSHLLAQLPNNLGGIHYKTKLTTGIPGQMHPDNLFKYFNEKTVFYQSVGYEEAASFLDDINKLDVKTTYRHPPVSPTGKGTERRIFKRLKKLGKSKILRCGTYNCIVAIQPLLRRVLPFDPEITRGSERINLERGKSTAGKNYPELIGKSKEYGEFLDSLPEEELKKKGIVRIKLGYYTTGARKALYVFRGVGVLGLVVGGYYTIRDLRMAWGTKEFPRVATVKSSEFVGGGAGSTIGGGIGVLLFCSEGVTTAICIVGAGLLALGGGIGGSHLGHEIGEDISDTLYPSEDSQSFLEEPSDYDILVYMKNNSKRKAWEQRSKQLQLLDAWRIEAIVDLGKKIRRKHPNQYIHDSALHNFQEYDNQRNKISILYHKFKLKIEGNYFAVMRQIEGLG